MAELQESHVPRPGDYFAGSDHRYRDGFNGKWGTGNGYFNGRLLLIARGAFPVLQKQYRDRVTLHVVGAYDMAADENANGDSDRGASSTSGRTSTSCQSYGCALARRTT